MIDETVDYDYGTESSELDNEPMPYPPSKTQPTSLADRVSKLEKRTTYLAIGTGIGFLGVVGMVGKLIQQFGTVMEQMHAANAQTKNFLTQLRQAQTRAQQSQQAQPASSGPVYDPGPQDKSEYEKKLIENTPEPIDLTTEPGDLL